MPPPRLLGGATKNRGRVVLGGLGVSSMGALTPGRGRAPAPAPVPASGDGGGAEGSSAQRLFAARANFAGRPVSISRAGQSFEQRDPVPVIMEPASTKGSARMPVSARGPHAVRASSKEAVAA